jgi:predicted nucleic acid-binding protein
MRLLIDTGVLAQLCHPKAAESTLVTEWLNAILADRRERHTVIVPEIADYELRRELLHLVRIRKGSVRSLRRLQQLESLLDYLPLDTELLHRAVELWAESRATGLPTAHPSGLDGDVILAAQAESVHGTVVTNNRRHLSRFVPSLHWTEIPI